jgi:drug/metabolite transporter (DMT)-like permease
MSLNIQKSDNIGIMKMQSKFLLVLLTGITFGSSIVFARFALKEIEPFTISVLRFAIASAAFLITLLFMKKKIPVRPVKLKDFAIVGILSTAIPLLLFYFALVYISSGIFTVFLASMPIFTAALAHLFLKEEKLNKNLLIGLLIAFFGVAILIGTKSSGLSNNNFDFRGPLFVLIGILSTAIGSVYTKSHLNNEDSVIISSAQTIAAFIFVTVLGLILGKFHLGNVSLLGWFSVFYNGIVGSYLAFWLIFSLIKKYGATASSLPTYIMPVISTLMGALLLKEIITPPLLIGAIIVLIGVFFSSRGIK